MLFSLTFLFLIYCLNGIGSYLLIFQNTQFIILIYLPNKVIFRLINEWINESLKLPASIQQQIIYKIWFVSDFIKFLFSEPCHQTKLSKLSAGQNSIVENMWMTQPCHNWNVWNLSRTIMRMRWCSSLLRYIKI